MTHRTTVSRRLDSWSRLRCRCPDAPAGQRVSTKSMCEAHGGSYSTTAKQCTYPAQPPPRSAAQICQMQGGELDPVSDECAINDRSK